MRSQANESAFISYTDYSRDPYHPASTPTRERYESPTIYLKTGASANGYPNSTFGSTARLPLPKLHKRQDFILPRSKMDNKLGLFPKAPRAINLNPAGRDSPNPCKYLFNDNLTHRENSSFSFSQSSQINSKVVVPEVRIQHLPSNTPGPGNYEWDKPIGYSKPKYSFGQRIGWSYLPNNLNHPPVTKYKPESVKQSQRFANISMGVGEREFTYIPRKKNIPGPASYDHSQYEKSRAYSVPRNDPTRRVDFERIPGPGAYELLKEYKKHDWEQQHLKVMQYKELRRPRNIELPNYGNKYRRSDTPN